MRSSVADTRPHDRAGLRPLPRRRRPPHRRGGADGARVSQLRSGTGRQRGGCPASARYVRLAARGAWRFWSKTGSPGAARPRRSRRSRTTSRRTGGALTPASGSHGRAPSLRALEGDVLDGTSTGIERLEAGAVPRRRHRREAADKVREWIEEEGWTPREAAAARPARPSDASLLASALCAYADAGDERFLATAERIRRARGDRLYRFIMEEIEAAFSTCSFWRPARRTSPVPGVATMRWSASARGRSERRRSLRGGARSRHRRVPRQHAAGASSIWHWSTAVSLAGGDDPP